MRGMTINCFPNKQEKDGILESAIAPTKTGFLAVSDQRVASETSLRENFLTLLPCVQGPVHLYP